MVCGCFWRMNMYCICLYFPSIFLTLLSWRCLPSLKVQVDQCEHFFAISSPNRGWPKPNFSPHFLISQRLHSCTAAWPKTPHVFCPPLWAWRHMFSPRSFQTRSGWKKWGMPGIRDALKSANCCNWFCFQLMHLKKLAKRFLAGICGMSVPVVSLGPQVWMQQSVPVPRVDTGCKPFIRCNAWLVCNSYQTKSAS